MVIFIFIVIIFYCSHTAGGDRQNHEDEEADNERSAADRTSGDPEEHVYTAEEDDQRTDRMVDRTQISQERRRGY